MQIIIETKTKKQVLQPAFFAHHGESQNPSFHYPTAALRNP